MANQKYSRKSEQVRADAEKIKDLFKKSKKRMTTQQIMEALNADLPPEEARSVASVYRSCKLYKEENYFNYSRRGKNWGLGKNTNNSNGIDAMILNVIGPKCIDADTGMTARRINNALGNGNDKKQCDTIMRQLQGMVAKKSLSRSASRPYTYFHPMTLNDKLNAVLQGIDKIADTLIEQAQILNAQAQHIKNMISELLHV